MNLAEIARIRLIGHQIIGPKFNTAQEVVAWMGAMQAQDYAMSAWAIGVRLPDSTLRAIEAAIDRGELLRTHLLRPTWHWVSSEDIHWMLELTAPQIKAKLKSRHNELGLDEATDSRCNTIFATALTGGRYLTREDLQRVLVQAKVETGDNRLYHILTRAELDGILCSGPIKNGKQTYALLEERVARRKTLVREEALATLAKRYFSSRGPATLQDFTWWSGLATADARSALEMVKPDFRSETIDGQTYWFPDYSPTPEIDAEAVYLLPAFDEIILSYKERSAALSSEKFARMVSSNGIFRPVIVRDGQVIGIWKRVMKKDRVVVDVELFGLPNDGAIESAIERASLRYGQFLQKKSSYKRLLCRLRRLRRARSAVNWQRGVW